MKASLINTLWISAFVFRYSPNHHSHAIFGFLLKFSEISLVDNIGKKQHTPFAL